MVYSGRDPPPRAYTRARVFEPFIRPVAFRHRGDSDPLAALVPVLVVLRQVAKHLEALRVVFTRTLERRVVIRVPGTQQPGTRPCKGVERVGLGRELVVFLVHEAGCDWKGMRGR